MAKGDNAHWMEKAFANSHGQFKAKAKAAGKSTAAMANDPGESASTKTKRQANLAKIGAKYGDMQEIREGPKEKETVVTVGQNNLAEGVKVNVAR